MTIDAFATRSAVSSDRGIRSSPVLELLRTLPTCRVANFTAAEWENYDRAKMAKQDLRGVVSAAQKEGLECGRSEGLSSPDGCVRYTETSEEE